MNNFIYQVFAIAITALLLPKLKISSLFGAIWLVLAISLVNTFVWNSDLFNFIPTNSAVLSGFGTKYLVLILTNGLIFFALVKLLPGVDLEGFLTAFIAPILFSIFTVLIQKYGHLVDWLGLFNITFDFITSLKNSLLGQAKL